MLIKLKYKNLISNLASQKIRRNFFKPKQKYNIESILKYLIYRYINI